MLVLLVAANMAISWMYFRRRAFVFYSGAASLALVLIASILGGVTVLTELEWWVVTLHLAIAETLIGCLIIAAVSGWNAPAARSELSMPERAVTLWALAAVVGTLLLILSGSFMVGYGAGSSCSTWPLCRGSLLPDGSAYAIHMGHRFVAAAVFVIVAIAVWRVWRSATVGGPVRYVTLIALSLFVAQIALGALLVWLGFSAELKAVHLSLATLGWIAVVFMAALRLLPAYLREATGQLSDGDTLSAGDMRWQPR